MYIIWSDIFLWGYLKRRAQILSFNSFRNLFSSPVRKKPCNMCICWLYASFGTVCKYLYLFRIESGVHELQFVNVIAFEIVTQQILLSFAHTCQYTMKLFYAFSVIDIEGGISGSVSEHFGQVSNFCVSKTEQSKDNK